MSKTRPTDREIKTRLIEKCIGGSLSKLEYDYIFSGEEEVFRRITDEIAKRYAKTIRCAMSLDLFGPVHLYPNGNDANLLTNWGCDVKTPAEEFWARHFCMLIYNCLANEPSLIKTTIYFSKKGAEEDRLTTWEDMDLETISSNGGTK